ncbi:MAG: transposase [Defluviitaleaceae bacterium]|nr:transposase [Defluviitaleaceae bacterium]
MWGLANRKFTCKDVFKFIKAFYAEWFPAMPNYKAFNRRYGYLADAIKTLASDLLSMISSDTTCPTHLIDSMPIVLAKQRRSGRAKVATEMCDKGYCDAKQMYFYGVRLHALGENQYKTIPQPKQLLLTAANVHDRKAAVEMLQDVYGIDLFADKAYIHAEWMEELRRNNRVNIITPIKLEKGQKELSYWDSIFSSAVSRVRQPIESFFNWLNEITQIQNACKIRSANGLVSFVFSRIAVACLILANIINI